MPLSTKQRQEQNSKCRQMHVALMAAALQTIKTKDAKLLTVQCCPSCSWLYHQLQTVPQLHLPLPQHSSPSLPCMTASTLAGNMPNTVTMFVTLNMFVVYEKIAVMTAISCPWLPTYNRIGCVRRYKP